MYKLYYCLDCRRVFNSDANCQYCGSEKLKELKKDSPVSIIGTKQKGKVFKIQEGEVKILIISESKERVIRDYKSEKLKKII